MDFVLYSEWMCGRASCMCVILCSNCVMHCHATVRLFSMLFFRAIVLAGQYFRYNICKVRQVMSVKVATCIVPHTQLYIDLAHHILRMLYFAFYPTSSFVLYIFCAYFASVRAVHVSTFRVYFRWLASGVYACYLPFRPDLERRAPCVLCVFVGQTRPFRLNSTMMGTVRAPAGGKVPGRVYSTPLHSHPTP